MPNDRRRFRGRSQFDIGGLLSGIAGVDGGGVELDQEAIAQVASEVPFDDNTFDANNVVRYKPVSGVKNFLSGGRANARANELNIAAQGGEIDRRLALQDADTAVTRDLNKVRSIRDIGNSAIAATLANEAEPDMLYLPDDPDIPPIYKAEANKYNTEYGNQTQVHGIKGAPKQLEGTIADTDYKKEATKNLSRDNTRKVTVSQDGSIFDTEKNVQHIRNVDPVSGKITWKSFDFSTGVPVEIVAKAPANTSAPAGVATSAKANSGGLLNRIKGAFSATPIPDEPIDYSKNNSPLPGDSVLNDYLGINPNNFVPKFVQGARGNSVNQKPLPEEIPNIKPAEDLDLTPDELTEYLKTGILPARLQKKKPVSGVKSIRTY